MKFLVVLRMCFHLVHYPLSFDRIRRRCGRLSLYPAWIIRDTVDESSDWSQSVHILSFFHALRRSLLTKIYRRIRKPSLEVAPTTSATFSVGRKFPRPAVIYLQFPIQVCFSTYAVLWSVLSTSVSLFSQQTARISKLVVLWPWPLTYDLAIEDDLHMAKRTSVPNI